ncbi:MAG TPA: tetratricopeptide repeat protein, partial [Methanospirillum sp.]|nr:tetratricopeptide repeat protein [Methanospirillum sp.]
MKCSGVLLLFVFFILSLPAAASPVDELVVKGNTYYDEGLNDEALAVFDEALIMDPEDLEALNGKGKTLKNMGLYEEAILQYDKAIEI